MGILILATVNDRRGALVRLGMRRKLVLVVLAVAVPLAAILATTYTVWFKLRIDSIESERLGYARLAGTSFRLIVKDMWTALSVASVHLGSSEVAGHRQAVLQKLCDRFPCENASMTDASGTVIASTDEAEVGKAIGEEPAIRDVLRDGKSQAIGPATLRKGVPSFFVTTPTHDEEGRLTGAIALLVDVRKLPDAMPIDKAQGKITIVDTNNHVAYCSTDLTTAACLETLTLPPSMRLNHRAEGITHQLRFAGGEREIAAVSKVAGLDWAAVSSIPADGGMGPILATLQQAILVAIFVLGVAFLAAVVLARGITGSLGALASGAQRIGAGDFDEPVRVRSGDEIEQVADVLDTVRLDLRRQMRELSDLEAASRELSAASTRGLPALTEVAVAVVGSLVSPRSMCILVAEPGCGLRTLVTTGPDAEACADVDTHDREKVVEAAHRQRRTFIIDDLADSDLRGIGSMLDDGVRSVAVVPLTVGDRAVGVLGVSSARAGAWARGSRAAEILGVLASQLAVSLENARLYTEERNVADTLQRAILALPDHVDGIRFGHLYRSASASAQVGGDFYDVFELGGGRIGLLLGDVSGKGISAAALTSLVKDTVRAYAFEDDDPVNVVEKTNQIVCRRSEMETFVTLFFGRLDVGDRSLRYCNAGHPQPLIVPRSGQVEMLGSTSPLVGAFKDVEYCADSRTLERDEMLLMYTDGIIEARREGDMFGMERLVATAERLRDMSPEELPAEIYAATEEFSAGRMMDDVALLAVALDEARDQST